MSDGKGPLVSIPSFLEWIAKAVNVWSAVHLLVCKTALYELSYVVPQMWPICAIRF